MGKSAKREVVPCFESRKGGSNPVGFGVSALPRLRDHRDWLISRPFAVQRQGSGSVVASPSTGRGRARARGTPRPIRLERRRWSRHLVSVSRRSCLPLLTVLLLAAPAPAGAQVVLHLTFDQPEALGADSSGNNHAAPFISGVPTATASGVSGGAVEFDGQTYLRWGSDIAATLAGSFTAAVWINWIGPLILCEIALQWSAGAKARQSP